MQQDYNSMYVTYQEIERCIKFTGTTSAVGLLSKQSFQHACLSSLRDQNPVTSASGRPCSIFSAGVTISQCLKTVNKNVPAFLPLLVCHGKGWCLSYWKSKFLLLCDQNRVYWDTRFVQQRLGGAVGIFLVFLLIRGSVFFYISKGYFLNTYTNIWNFKRAFL